MLEITGKDFVSGRGWDAEWSPLDIIGLRDTRQLVEPFSFLPGGVCLDCGGSHVSGLTILVKPLVDIFSPTVKHWDRAAIFGVMACADWHTYLLPSDYPDSLRTWLFSAIRNNGDRTYAKNDVGDVLSDRWHRAIEDVESYPAAAAAFGEAARTQLEHRLEWPLPNVRMYIPGSEEGGAVPGYRLWRPTAEERNVSGVITLE